MLWSSHSERLLEKWYASNVNVEVHAYPESGRYCVVNNTYEPQRTTVYTDGASFPLDLAASEIRWFAV